MTFVLRRALLASAVMGSKPPSFDFTFTATGADTLTLQRVTPTGGTCTVTWGDGTSTVIADGNTGATTHTYAGAGAYSVSIYNSQRITWYEVRSDTKIGGDISGWVLPANLTDFRVQFTSLSGDISSWVLPMKLAVFSMYSTSVRGDISGWVLPAKLTTFYVDSTSVSGDISGWVLPASLMYFRVNSTPLSGDISGWVLPANLTDFRVNSTSLSGDISGWVLPANLTIFFVHLTSVRGDISGWVLPAKLTDFYVYSTSVSGAPNCTGAVKLTGFQYQNCGLNQTTVDAILWSLYQATVAPRTGTGGTINVGGTNAAPTGTFQAASACPVTVATDGKEIAHELLNDSCGAFANHWATVTISA